MNLYITKKLQEKLKIEHLSVLPAVDDIYSWRANYVQGHGGHRFVVFMNDATRLTIVINEAKVAKLKKLAELFTIVLRTTLLELGFNPDVADRYMGELGEIAFAKNTDRKQTARLIKCADATWYALRNLTDDVELSVWANNYPHSAPDGSDGSYSSPRQNAIKAFAVYGLPVLKSRAFDLNIKLDLDTRFAVRCLRVPANITFKNLHTLIQRAFDWKNSHLHSFGLFKQWSENPYARPDIELVTFINPFEDNADVNLIESQTLDKYVPEYRKILYRYDFGDDWRHYIEVETIIDDCEEELPILLFGEGDAPPEDVGGPGGFADFLEIIADPNHEEHEEMKLWAQSQLWVSFDFKRAARMMRSRW